MKKPDIATQRKILKLEQKCFRQEQTIAKLKAKIEKLENQQGFVLGSEDIRILQEHAQKQFGTKSLSK